MRGWMLIPALLAIALLHGCSRGDADAPVARDEVTRVTTVTATTRDVPVLLRAIGRMESRAAPSVASEVDGSVLRLAVDEGDRVEAGAVLAELDATPLKLELDAARAESARIAALLANGERRVERLRDLHRKGFIAREQLDDGEAELAVLRAQRDAESARLRIAEDQHAKTVIRAPLAGSVEKRLVSAGDFVRRGTPLFELATSAELRAVLPFSEQQAEHLAPGLPVRLSSPLAPERSTNGVVTEIRPAVGDTSRAVWAVVDIANPGGWRPDATVSAEVVVETRAGAVVVPARAVVRRPAGDVVYVIEGARAVQHAVSLGERLDGGIEIRSGLAAGAVLALEGATYLSDGAPVQVSEPAR